MVSPECERAIAEATRVGNAILKFISPNDVGLTGGHQCGYYLPKPVWKMFTSHAPAKNKNNETAVSVTWQDGRTTDSRVKWYGKGTRSEYRLTRFGKGFPFLTADSVGELLVLIPESHAHFTAFVLDSDEDIDEIAAALGVEIIRSWAVYRGGVAQVESEDECVEKRFRHFAGQLEAFPTGAIFSEQARDALIACVKGFNSLVSDELLMRSMDAEYALFRLAERQICQSQISGRVFKDVDDFLKTASSIMNRRKARAGRSLENHVEYALKRSGIPHVMRPHIDGEPDVIIPSVEAYLDRSFPEHKLTVVGIKTTCKDRWRQVVNEARRVVDKHILTIQQGISAAQLSQMHSSRVKLVVPAKLHKQYPKGTPITLLSIEEFLKTVKARLA
ncbi:MAG TPA: type II restriction endonuclease [Terriglobales bacterium]|nr:type II restriction endonuclease [Terriglobales bacterium]